MPRFEPGISQDGSIVSYIQIDYERHSTDPARVFRTAAQLIEAFYAVERDLAQTVEASIRPVLLLEEIEAGSLLVWLRTVLEQVNDEALLNLDWKPLVGQYLVSGKNQVLRFLSDRTRIRSGEEVEQLQRDLLDLNPAFDVAQLPTPGAVPLPKLLTDVQHITQALQHLHPEDRAIYVSPEGVVPLNRSFSISSEQIEELLTRDVITSELVLNLKVKKPDYLGSSMWEFRYDDRVIEAKLLDEHWLAEFQSRVHDVRPGDSLRVRVRAEEKRGQQAEIVAVRYYILEVLGTVREPSATQTDLLPPEEV